MTNQHRLDRNVIPTNYRLRLEPNLAEATFTGSVSIACDAGSTTSIIVLNAIELDILSASVHYGDTVVACETSLDDDLQRLTLTCNDEIPAGPIAIEIAFNGILNDQLHGFYRSTYTSTSDPAVGTEGTAEVEHTIATTQFQSTDARRAFPCFDEPDFKATFDVTLVVEPEFLAIANSAEVSATAIESGKIERTYATTMKMSTYLVAFVVGPLEQTDPIDVGGVPVTVVHRPGQGHLTSFALESAASALEYFTEYYGIAYPGDKIDMIAIPDFAFGAMENLGCITFREVLLIVDPETATQPELQRITDVVSHELAHMWFGDLVTMAWWEGIWLNEAFATFMEMKATDNFKPEWDRWTNFGLSRTAAFATDSLHATRPIEFAVESPADAEAMFDILTYEKGAAVVRMLEQYLGEEVFRDGIRHYLARHSFGNTVTTDLWDALEETSGQKVRQIMETWIYQGGYPVVAVDDAGSLVQNRFTFLPEDPSLPNDPNLPEGSTSPEGAKTPTWSVPVKLRDTGGTEHRVLLEADGSVDSPVAAADIATLNAQASGFYRTKISAEQLRNVGDNGPGDLSSVERFGLVDDMWALTTAGQLDVANYLDLLRGFTNESSVAVWQRITGSLASIDHLLDDGSDKRSELAAITGSLLQPALDRLGLEAGEDESENDREARATIFEALATTGGGSAVSAGLATTARDIYQSSRPDPAMFSAAVNVIAATGSAEDFETFLDLFTNAESPQDMQRYLYSLADFPSAALGQRLAEMTLTDDIRSQNGPYVLLRLLSNRQAGWPVWEFISGHWDELLEKFPSNSISRMLGGITAISKPDEALRVSQFLADHQIAQGKKVIDQHLERQRVQIAFRERLVDGSLSL